MTKVSTVVSAAVVLALVAVASMAGLLYFQASRSLSEAKTSIGEFRAELASLQAQVDSLSAEVKAQGNGTTSGIGAQLAAISNLLVSLRNTSSSASLKSELSALQEQLNDVQMVEVGCGGSTPVSQGPVGNLTPVLLMQPSSTATVCVTYREAWSDNPGAFNLTVWPSFWFQNGVYSFQMLISRNNSVSDSFTISSFPGSVRPEANVTYVTVMYRITALPNSTGFYDHSAPYGFCGDMPMAVG